MGDRGSGTLGAVGRTLPDRPGGAQPAQVRTRTARHAWTRAPANACRVCPSCSRAVERAAQGTPKRCCRPPGQAARPGKPSPPPARRLDPLASIRPRIAGKVWADDPASGKRRDLDREEEHAFWAWAVGRGPPLHGPPCRGTAGAQPPQPGQVPPARQPASSSRCCRSPPPRPTPNGSWWSAPSSPTCCREIISRVRGPRRGGAPGPRLRLPRTRLAAAVTALVPAPMSGPRTVRSAHSTSAAR